MGKGWMHVECFVATWDSPSTFNKIMQYVSHGLKHVYTNTGVQNSLCDYF